MQITKEQLINFVLENGDIFGGAKALMESIEETGVDRVLEHASHQMVACTAHYKGAVAQLEEHTDVNNALMDYFCDGAFDHLSDMVYSGWL